MHMRHFLKKLLIFRIGQKTSRGFARTIGLDSIAGLVGIIGGLRAMRHHG
jgi:hypothetical protein